MVSVTEKKDLSYFRETRQSRLAVTTDVTWNNSEIVRYKEYEYTRMQTVTKNPTTASFFHSQIRIKKNIGFHRCRNIRHSRLSDSLRQHRLHFSSNNEVEISQVDLLQRTNYLVCLLFTFSIEQRICFSSFLSEWRELRWGSAFFYPILSLLRIQIMQTGQFISVVIIRLVSFFFAHPFLQSITKEKEDAKFYAFYPSAAKRCSCCCTRDLN